MYELNVWVLFMTDDTLYLTHTHTLIRIYLIHINKYIYIYTRGKWDLNTDLAGKVFSNNPLIQELVISPLFLQELGGEGSSIF